jgi:multidrug efflux pump subunit AcrA (membrane-fusion protein)
LEKARAALPLGLIQKRLAVEKMHYERHKAAERLRKLRKDREAMIIKSPADGIVYHSKATRGQWTTAAAMAAKLQRGGTLTPDEVFLTIVKPRPLFMRAAIEEKDLMHVRPAAEGKCLPASDPEHKLPAKVTTVSAVPITPGSFEAKLHIELGPDAAAIMPGMACTVRLVAYRNDQALTVPAAAGFPDEGDEDQHYVYVAGKDGKPKKRPVRTGKTAGGRTEIRDGLHEGEQVLPEKPADK